MTKLTLQRKIPINLPKNLERKISIPYWVFINGQPIGFMRDKEISIQIPEGTYDIGVRIVFALWKWRFYIGSERKVNLTEKHTTILIDDRERWWNILFDIDMVIWFASFFFTLPEPWNMLYHLISEGFFAIWLLRVFMIRKQYFKLTLLDESA